MFKSYIPFTKKIDISVHLESQHQVYMTMFLISFENTSVL